MEYDKELASIKIQINSLYGTLGNNQIYNLYDEYIRLRTKKKHISNIRKILDIL